MPLSYKFILQFIVQASQEDKRDNIIYGTRTTCRLQGGNKEMLVATSNITKDRRKKITSLLKQQNRNGDTRLTHKTPLIMFDTNKNEMSRTIYIILEVQGRSTTCPFNAVSESILLTASTTQF